MKREQRDEITRRLRRLRDMIDEGVVVRTAIIDELDIIIELGASTRHTAAQVHRQHRWRAGTILISATWKHRRRLLDWSIHNGKIIGASFERLNDYGRVIDRTGAGSFPSDVAVAGKKTWQPKG